MTMTATGRRSKQITVRATGEEFAAWDVEADEVGMTVAEWLRETANGAVYALPKVRIVFAETVRWNDRLHAKGTPIPKDLALNKWELAKYFSYKWVVIELEE